MRAWIFINGQRTEPADSADCFFLADITDRKSCPLGFMRHGKFHDWKKDFSKEWEKLVEYAYPEGFDYLCIYLRECWPIKDSEIDTVETLTASRERARVNGHVYQYWGK